MRNIQDTLTICNGIKIPCVGFGTWKLPEGEATGKVVRQALDVGYRHIDTASEYGNERSVGSAIKESGLSRNDLFVTSKLWNSDRGYERTSVALAKSLEKLQLDYLDLYLIHWPAAKGSPEDWANVNADTWRAFERLYREGLVKAIGVSNFKQHHLEALSKTCDIKPMVNQIECHPGYPQTELRAFCLSHDILVEAWSPLGSGRVLDDPSLKALAEEYNRSVAQLCIKWCLQNQTLPLPRSTKIERMEENADVFDFDISAKDMEYLNNLPEFGFSGLDPDKVEF